MGVIEGVSTHVLHIRCVISSFFLLVHTLLIFTGDVIETEPKTSKAWELTDEGHQIVQVRTVSSDLNKSFVE